MMVPMRLSVALCTYNGARHLPDQLASLAAQTRLPNELIVCDDGSSDGTITLLQRFAQDAPFPVVLHRNEQHLGTGANFGQAISLCRGEIIALCDQDDVWLAHKLAVLERTLLDARDAGLVFSDAEVVDGALRPLGYRLWDARNFTNQQRRGFAGGRALELLLRRDVVTGATMAFRSRFRDLVLPIPHGVVHDAWIALVLVAVSDAVILPDSLILYRAHAQQQIGIRPGLVHTLRTARRRTRREYLDLSEAYGEAYNRLRRRSEQLKTPAALDQVLAKVEHLRRRGRMSPSRVRRLPVVLREILAGGYHRYAEGWRSVAKDLLFASF